MCAHHQQSLQGGINLETQTLLAKTEVVQIMDMNSGHVLPE